MYWRSRTVLTLIRRPSSFTIVKEFLYCRGTSKTASPVRICNLTSFAFALRNLISSRSRITLFYIEHWWKPFIQVKSRNDNGSCYILSYEIGGKKYTGKTKLCCWFLKLICMENLPSFPTIFAWSFCCVFSQVPGSTHSWFRHYFFGGTLLDIVLSYWKCSSAGQTRAGRKHPTGSWSIDRLLVHVGWRYRFALEEYVLTCRGNHVTEETDKRLVHLEGRIRPVFSISSNCTLKYL